MEIYVVAAGMVSAVGYNVQSSCAAIEASISGIEEVSFVDQHYRSLRGGKVKLPQWCEGQQKFVDLAAPVIHECLKALPPSLHHTIPLLIGLPLVERQNYPQEENATILSEIEKKLELPHHPDSCLIPYSQVSGIKAIKKAYALLSEKKGVDYCVIAGTDCYLQQQTISYYLREMRLVATNQSNGFFPGEAGGAILVSRHFNKGKAKICITGVGEAQEPAPINSGKIFKAEGMTSAIKEAATIAGIDLSQVSLSLSDMNGEHYKFDEINLALGRFNQAGAKQGVDMDIWHPAEFIGEVGAAIVPCLLSYLWYMSQNDTLSHRYILISAANDSHERAAIIIRHDLPTR